MRGRGDKVLWCLVSGDTFYRNCTILYYKTSGPVSGYGSPCRSNDYQRRNLFHGFLRTCDAYIVGTTTDTWNATLLIFILSVGGLIAVMSKMGGTQAMALTLAKKAKTPGTH